MRPERRAAIGALLFVYVAVRLFWWYDGQYWRGLNSSAAAIGLFKILAWVVPSVLAALLLSRSDLRRSLEFLGLDASVARGLRFGLLATLPLALAVTAASPKGVDLDVLVGTALLGPLAEEVLFRGFLINVLRQRARWPLGWAIVVSAVSFGAAHVADLDLKILDSLALVATGEAGIAATVALGHLASLSTSVAAMAAGGAVFAWVFYRCGTLWPAVGLHAAMNLWLTLASGDSRTVAGLHVDTVGIAQATSIVLALVLTLRWRPAPTGAWSTQPS